VLAALLAGAAWAGTAGLAYAGGPTSVLIASPTAQRAAGLYYTESRYEELAQAIGGGGDQPAGSLSQPASVDLDNETVVRLTWMVHDVSVWRIDGIYITRSDGIWVNTVTGNLGDQHGRWHRPSNDAALLAVLKSAGIPPSNAALEGDSSLQASPAAASTAVAASGPSPAADSGTDCCRCGCAGGACPGCSRVNAAPGQARQSRAVRAPGLGVSDGPRHPPSRLQVGLASPGGMTQATPRRHI
jgi:hypothetical protein